ncbi:helix-turn-helix domain-containing protein [Hymenobacter sp. ASUV-10]|uniref:Helix-turn-helix domain-containing protein n=1 Tax=Hymenobacter aranciens TaxID=3063996 RepID=A0ABT9BH15_9BACT|nr:helix-turn-helix domain-containing protein [Hymenobacter sp. ASUV-10]MDO7877563.1 helix-turn-helix domain-containing protein [Hymenobacter sp. ASUV-10]
MLLSSSSATTTGRPLPLDQPPPAGWPRPKVVRLARLRALAELLLPNSALTPADLAAAVHLSERSFYRYLRELTGHTPAGFVRELRLLRARQLLQAGAPDTVAAVAYAVGFVNAAHFGRAYTRRFGYPPGRERDADGPG